MANGVAIIRADNQESIRRMSDEDAGILLKAIMAYACGEEVSPESLSYGASIIFPVICGQIDRATAAYDKCVENGKRGGRPKKETEKNQDETKTQTSDAKTETRVRENENLPDPDPNPVLKESTLKCAKEKRRFVPPTVDEVREYCRERGNGVDAQTFVDFYASKGWMVGKSPMKDWKASVRTWERDRNNKPPDRPPKKPTFDFDQRAFDYDAFMRSNGL